MPGFTISNVSKEKASELLETCVSTVTVSRKLLFEGNGTEQSMLVSEYQFVFSHPVASSLDCMLRDPMPSPDAKTDMGIEIITFDRKAELTDTMSTDTAYFAVPRISPAVTATCEDGCEPIEIWHTTLESDDQTLDSHAVMPTLAAHERSDPHDLPRIVTPDEPDVG